MKPVRLLFACLFLVLVHSVAWAQSWPTKPVRLLVPYPPGGSADILARPIAQKLAEMWGQPVVVDNRGGAGGTIATDIVAKAAPDGHTIILVLAAHAINHSLYPRLPYDTLRDFAPVTWMANVPLVVVTPTTVPTNSIKELIALAKAKPNSFSFASSGNGNTSHLAGELFKKVTGVEMVHVPYKGSAPAQLALLASEVQLMIDALPSQLAHIKSGKMKALAVTGAERSPLLPQVPTVVEAGLPDFVVEGWYGIVAPAGTPKGILSKMSADITSVMRSPDVQARLVDGGYDIIGSTPEQFDKHIRAEVARWSTVVRESGARVD